MLSDKPDIASLSLDPVSHVLSRKVDASCTVSHDGINSLLENEHRHLRNIETRKASDEKTLSELMAPGPSSRPLRQIETVKSSECLEGMISPSIRSAGTPRAGLPSFEPHPMVGEAWENLRRSLVYFRGIPVGTIAALDPTQEALNYNQVFVRDFVPSALAFLMNGESEVVKNFLLKALRLQAWEKRIDCFTLGEGAMPASFKVLHDPVRKSDTMAADFGESAIGRVAPVDSGFWWIIMLRAYTKSTGDHSLADMPDCQRGMRLILSLCLAEGFDTFPTLLCADGCSMIDRRMF
ncbi:hypothetical protein O6H91_12G105800 [Diphasiastrum complanatum]|uniref:Uncharacterized protein n=2 Tax=Diphasiastrum complanatum TaxID=34168 RepID=A0ACC2C1P5_DIPCM|nr:hypothetical protein O6H91_12G050700 [Diphasiastrum complanatum]KAJ7537269.1 hypothetical protein O6H91_12G105800 [Diphasiastrum complanatum]